ncbi:MAG: TetR/AcrR family transcriptional regulator [Ruminococcaceae bacterium]|nr:TetR/AcrR family transcriptional regulator [Oscillospiraceae bacterium]
MPPKIKFTKEQIIQAGLELVRKYGGEELSARSVSNELGCSPQPIFSYFENMEDLKKAVLEAARGVYKKYISEGLNQNAPFKGAGMQYLRFADEEPKLFEFLFMIDHGEKVVTQFLSKNDVNYSNILEALEKSWNVEKEKAERIYNHMSVYTYGLSILFAKKAGIFTMEDAERMISEMFMSLIEYEGGQV